MKKLIAQIERVAPSETRVCILGETGTGKELVARAIHEKSPRHENPFITLNCAAVPAELIESELVGHDKGALTVAAAVHGAEFDRKDKILTEEAIAELRKYGWPGNVRELRNVVERLALLADDDNVSTADVRLVLPTSDSASSGASSSSSGTGTLAERTEAFE